MQILRFLIPLLIAAGLIGFCCHFYRRYVVAKSSSESVQRLKELELQLDELEDSANIDGFYYGGD